MSTDAPQPKKASFLKKLSAKLDSISFGGAKDREYLLENMSMLTAGGMTVLSAIRAVREETRSRSMQRTLDTLTDDIESGSPLWKAFVKSKMFKEHIVSLVRIGEETGKLSDNLKMIAIQEAKERSFQSKIRSAMMYPVFVLSLTVIIGVLIAWFILPRLAGVFEQLRVELPTITKWLIKAGTFLGEYGHIALPVFITCVVLIVYFTFFFKHTKFIGQSFLFALPGIKGLIQEVELARFGYLLGTLLQAGIPVTTALDSLEKATTFPHYKKLYAHLRERISDGNSFQKSFLEYKKIRGLIPAPIQQLVVAGEQSGHLSSTLISISNTYEEKTEQTTKNIAVILEPILLVIVWLGVVSVALAVVLPIYSLIGGLNTDPSAKVQTQSPVAEPSVDEEDVTPMLRITAKDIDYVNLREEPSTSGRVIGRATFGEIYQYSGERDGWHEVVLSTGERGWIFSEYADVF